MTKMGKLTTLKYHYAHQQSKPPVSRSGGGAWEGQGWGAETAGESARGLKLPERLPRADVPGLA